MSKLISKILLSALMMTICGCVMSAQVSIGLRDTRYVYVGYTFKNHYTAKFEQSVYAEKIGCQYFRLSLGYKSLIAGLEYQVSPFYGQAYNGNYWNTGARIDIGYRLGRVGLAGAVNPLYDSFFHYTTCFQLGADVKIAGPLSVAADYTDIPVYRMKEERVRAGLLFEFNKFRCKPMLSIPVKGHNKFKSLRMEVSIDYTF